MLNFLQTIWRQMREFFAKLTRGQKIRLGVLGAILLTVIVVATILFSRVEYAVLYADMENADAAEVYALIEGMNTKVKSEPTGTNKTTLSVPANQREQLRMQLAAQGYPKSGTSNEYAIYLSGTGLTSSSETQRMMYMYQTQDNLRRSIITLAGIEDASVILTLKKESAFVIDRDTSTSTASVILTLAPDYVLSNEGVRSVAHVVSGGSPGLTPENVFIVDSNGRSYTYVSVGEEIEEPQFNLNDKYAAERAFEKELNEKVTNMLTPVFGPGKVFVQSKVTMNFDKVQIGQKNYSMVPDANEQEIAVSYRELRESIANAGDTAQGVAGLDENGGSATYPVAGDAGDAGQYSRYEVEVNNALNEINTTIDKAPGYIEALTMSVLYDQPEDDEEDYTEHVQRLVMNAAGIKNKKDVTAQRMPIPTIDTAETANLGAQLVQQSERNQLIRLGLIALALIIVVALLAKLLRDITKPKPIPVLETALVAENGAPMYDLMVGDEEGEDGILDLPEFEINTRHVTRERIEQLIEKDPESVAQLLRGWLSEE